jgi:hypothetical protein
LKIQIKITKINRYQNITEQKKQMQNGVKNIIKLITNIEPNYGHKSYILLTEPQQKKKKIVKTCDLPNNKVYSHEIFHQIGPFIYPFLMILTASSEKTIAAFQACIRQCKV